MFSFEFLKQKTKMLVWVLCVLESLLYLLLSIIIDYDNNQALPVLVHQDLTSLPTSLPKAGSRELKTCFSKDFGNAEQDVTWK